MRQAWRQRTMRLALTIPVVVAGWLVAPTPATAQTAQGELEGRAAPVALRRCVGGANTGALCRQNADCPGSTCPDRNIFNVSVAVMFNASAAQLTTIQNALSAGSATLFDVTDGQVQFGQATIHNNAFSTTNADFRISSTGVWWNANTGNWKVGGAVNVSMDNIQSAGAVGESVAHEFLHLAFDPRDEYESRAAGCGASTPGDSCPVAGSGGTNCIMDQGGTGTPGQFSELCWGQGNNANVTDFTNGDHDADNSTEQSRCRSNRSCWDQVVWSYPHTILKPTGAPDPAASGATVNSMKFRVIDNTSRVVLVLDRSGSMALESPARIDRLKTAANDFIALAPNNTELGIVAFASTNTNEVAISALGATRTAWTNVVDALTPTTRTNIGGALDRARTLIMNAGGVTGNTFVVLMTDGLNNEPQPTPQTTLNNAIAALMADGIEVYVTCTGGDLGLASQCSEIATGTGGFYVDSADASKLPLAFGEIAARGFGHEMIGEFDAARRNALLNLFAKVDAVSVRKFREKPTGTETFAFLKGSTVKPRNIVVDHLPFIAPKRGNRHQFFVEKGSDSALFTVQWKDAGKKVVARAISPSGQSFRMRPMPLGLFVQVPAPQTGVWSIEILGPSNGPVAATDYVARAFSRNVNLSIAAGVRRPHVRPGEPIYAFAYPRTNGHAVSSPLRTIKALVTRPDGTHDLLEFTDQGRDPNGEGDDVADDGVFTAVYRRTDLRGAYHISSFWPINEWGLAQDAIGHTFGPSNSVVLNRGYQSPAFLREVRLSATVIEPGKDIERKPEDPPRRQ